MPHHCKCPVHMASDATAMLRNAVPRSAGVRPRLLLLLVLLLSQGWTAAGKVELIQNAEVRTAHASPCAGLDC